MEASVSNGVRNSPVVRAGTVADDHVFDKTELHGRRAAAVRLPSWTGREMVVKRLWQPGRIPSETPDMPEYHTVAKVGSIPEGEGRAFAVAGRMIAVFLRNGEYLAINDLCPHMGASLAEGYLEGECVTCPWHAWRFSIRDGLWLDNPRAKLCADTFRVRVVEDDIQVEV
jgi:nitrite reductase (NADH) small subunit/3-phenylpropionate/trans-cinnamate dioxygenase ferredoxin subunit